jgi:hypothetical protein
MTTAPDLRNLNFGFFDDSGPRKVGRILMFYSFETEDRAARSGILHFDTDARRFMGPRHDAALTQAALDFLERSGRLPEPPEVPKD